MEAVVRTPHPSMRIRAEPTPKVPDGPRDVKAARSTRWIVKEPNDQRSPHSSKLTEFGGVALAERTLETPLSEPERTTTGRALFGGKPTPERCFEPVWTPWSRPASREQSAYTATPPA